MSTWFPTIPAVGEACGSRVGVGVGCRGPVVGEGVGVAAAGVPGAITIVCKLKPVPGPGLGQSPGTKSPNSSYEPRHPPPPPQLLISRVIITNNATGAIISHLNRHDIESRAMTMVAHSVKPAMGNGEFNRGARHKSSASAQREKIGRAIGGGSANARPFKTVRLADGTSDIRPVGGVTSRWRESFLARLLIDYSLTEHMQC
jgi:hypothetical protein